MSRSSYHHQPLDTNQGQIRLFKITQPFDEATGRTLRGTLETFQVSCCPRYYALSYVWGSEYGFYIYVDNEAFPVLRNLFDFLCSYSTICKLHTETRCPLHEECPGTIAEEYIWIDQLCIDQRSINEKNHQIQLMSQIYTNASLTLAWLGRYEEEMALAMDFINAKRLIKSTTVRDGLARSKYWSRLWIVQEWLLSRELTLLCGHASVTRSSFKGWAESAAWFRSQGLYAYEGNIPILEYSHRREMGRDGIYGDLPGLIFYFCDLKCADPKDRVYGVTGLLPPGELAILQPDYAKTVGQIFEDTILCEIRDALQCDLEVYQQLYRHPPEYLHYLAVQLHVALGLSNSAPRSEDIGLHGSGKESWSRMLMAREIHFSRDTPSYKSIVERDESVSQFKHVAQKRLILLWKQRYEAKLRKTRYQATYNVGTKDAPVVPT